jgi:YD repeat-containing protein
MKQRKFLTGLLTLILVIVSLHPAFGQAPAEESEPYVPIGILVSELGDEVPSGRLNVRFPPRDPVQVGEEIRHLLQQPDSISSGPILAQTVPPITAEIQTLATGLENDPLAIYDYVHNHIDYIPSWGLLKNPRETLLAGAGNAFDQAALLAALLEAAGLETQYVWGNIQVSKADAMNWVGSNNPSTVGNVFASGGIPTTDEGSTLLMTHIWVEVCDGGTGPSCTGGVWRSLDPSFKSYSEQAGQDLRPLLGYNQSTFIGRAESGATITSDYVRNLNYANIRDDLESYALNLVNNLRTGDTFIYPEDLLGSRQIVPVESTGYPPPPSYTVVTISGQATDIPDSLAYELTIQLPGISYTVNVDDIAGERITIFYECATPTDCQTLDAGGGVYNVEPAYEVDMVPRLRIGGTVVATGSAVALGSWNNQLDVTLATPISGWSPTFSQFLTAGEWYALPMRLQTVSNHALSRHIDLLNEAMSQGLDPDDERVLGQILYVLGLSYFNEVDLGDRIDSRLAEIVHIPHFSIMIASRNLIVWVEPNPSPPPSYRPVALDPASHTVDVRLNVHSAVSAEDPADADRERAWFFSAGMRGSAAEHAIIEQLQPVSAVSTVQLLRLAIENGQRIYYITPSNWNAIYPSLNHDTHVLNSIVNALNNGWHAVISQNEVTYGQWQGSGWIELDPVSGSAAYLISGYINPSARQARLIVNGGGGCCPQPPGDSPLLAEPARTVEDLSREQAAPSTPDETQENLKKAIPPETSPEEAEETDQLDGIIADPVNATTGSLLYHHVDLAPLGGRGIPLRFERFYVSSRHSLTSTLGYGWSHTYNTRFYTSTDWVRGFGGRTVLEAAPALAAAQVGFDLFDTTTIPHQRFATDVIVAQWLMAQITDNAATLSEPDGSVSAYLHLMDGEYEPPTSRPRLDAVTIGSSGAALAWEDGRRTHFDANGRLTILEDANGNQTMLSYNAQGCLNQVSDPVGRHLNFSYDAQNQLIQVTDPAGRTFHYSYDAQGDLQTYTDPLGGTTTYTYDAGHRLDTVTDPLGVTFIDNQYNALGQVSAQTNGRGGQNQWLYGGDHTIVIDPLGYRTTYDYDKRGRLLSIQDPLGNRRSATYDAADHQVTRTNGLDQDTTFAYDTWGRLTTTTDPLGYSTTWGYDATGNPTSYTDKRGKTWSFTYDVHHNLKSITNPLGDRTDYTYNGSGQLTRAENDAGIYATYGYDTRGNLTRITNALGGSQWGYDIVGRPTSFTDGVGNTTNFSYDALDNLMQITDPLGNATDYAYDANGSMIGITDANSHTTTYAYDAQFNLAGVTDPLGGVTSYDYDANNRLVRVTDANSHETTYGYDPAGRLITITDPLGRAVTFTYNAADRLIAFDRADGSSIGYQRDALGRLTKIDYPTGSDITFEYDAAGNLTHAARGSEWSAGYVYDNAGHLITIEDESRNLTTNYEYNAASRRTRLKVERDTTVLYDVAYVYNDASRVTTLTDQTRTPADTVSFSYNTAGHPIRITTPGGAYTDFAYDAASRLTAVSHHIDPSEEIASYTYAYDDTSNITAVNETTPAGVFAITYTYDALDRLTEETYPRYTIEFDYDATGNLTSRTDTMGTMNLTYDDANQLQSRGSESFDYDQHGNLTTWWSDHGTYSFAYNYENVLTDLVLPDGATLSFTHDAFDRRLIIQGPAGTRSYLHDGLNILLGGGGNLDQTAARYLYGNDELVARQNGLLGFTAYLGDALDNVRLLADANGQPFDAYHLEAYGYPPESAGIDDNSFRHDGKLGVYQPDVPSAPFSWMGYRDFGPFGSFFTKDPLPGNLPETQTMSDYRMGRNPVGDNDCTGLRPQREGAAGLEERDNLANLSVSHYAEPRPTREGTGLGEPRLSRESAGFSQLNGLIASSVEEKGYVALDFQPVTDLIPPGRPGLREAPPTRLESLPVAMGGLPTHRCCGLMQATTPEADSTQWLPVSVHGSNFALTCTADNSLLAGAFNAGLFRSLDSGHAIWDKAYTASVGEFAIADATTFYAGTRYSGALKSGDGGGSWTPINTGLAANHVYALVTDPVTPTRLFAGTEMGLFVSNDGGASWGRPAGTLPGRSVSELAFAGNTLLTVSEFGLYRSLDGGSTWLTPTTDLPAVRINVLLAGSPAGTVYAGTALGPYKSTDGGDTWTTWGTGMANQDVHALAIDPADANHVVAGTTAGLFVSTDGGSTWGADTHPGLDGIASQVGALAFCPGGGDDNLYLGAGGGVYALRTPTAPASVTIAGPTTVTQSVSTAFTVTVSPRATTLPLAYTWEATEQTPLYRTSVYKLSNSMSFSWNNPGDKPITVTASNSVGSVSVSHTVSVVPHEEVEHYIYLPLVLRNR